MVRKKRRVEKVRNVKVPSELERVVLSSGPFVLRSLISENGGISSSARISNTSKLTLARWMNYEPGAVFRGRQDNKIWRSIWPGYPSPFPALDRMCEELYGEESSYLGELVERTSWETAFKVLRSKDGFGMSSLRTDRNEFREICQSLQIPKSTELRLWSGVTYPMQWRALDDLAMAVNSEMWIVTVISHPSPISRKIPKPALDCFIAKFYG
jgi:hypothetical protein